MQLPLLVMLAILAMGSITAFDIQWWNQATYSNSPANTLKQWAEGMEGRVGMAGTGKTFYVDSGVTNEGDGSSWTNAKDTLDEAVGLCTASRGDVIYVAQGHTEAMGTGADVVDLDVAGISVIGCGTGMLRPIFDYTDYDTGTFAVGAANILIQNCIFRANVTDVNDAIEVEAAGDDCTIRNCSFIVNTAATDEFLDCIVLGDAADRLIVENCYFNMKGGAADHAIFFDYDSTDSIIRNNVILGDYAVANIKGDTTLSVDLLILDNVLMNGISGAAGLNAQPCIELLDGTGGILRRNSMAADVATHLLIRVADDMIPIENYSTDDVGDDTGAILETGSATIAASADG
jgi:hypothetical protein